MDKQAIVNRVIEALNLLPENEAEQVADFAEGLLSKCEDRILSAGIEKLTEESEAFAFLKEEEDLYTAADIKRPYIGKE
ncbi:MAG: hypothetical protein V4543_02475 [Bacteroidota bacterium]